MLNEKRPRWILNIDDDKDDRELFCDALKEIDPTIDCTSRSNASEGLLLLSDSKHLPDFIFLDINMPKVDGVECLKMIRDDERLSGIPVVILSTTLHHPAIDSIRKLNARYIKKESSFEAFVRKVKLVLEASRSDQVQGV